MGRAKGTASGGQDRFGAIVGTRAGRALIAPGASGPPLSVVAPNLDFSALTDELIEQQRPTIRKYLEAVGVRTRWANHLWYEGNQPGFKAYKHTLHLRAHDLTDSPACPKHTDEYGSVSPSPTLTRALRGSWQDPDTAGQKMGLEAPLQRCRECERLTVRDRDRERFEEEQAETFAYPLLPAASEDEFRAQLQTNLMNTGCAGDPTVDPAALDVCRGAALNETLLQTALRDNKDDHGFRETLGAHAYRNLVITLPRDPTQTNRLLAASSMRIHQFLSVADQERLLRSVLPDFTAGKYQRKEAQGLYQDRVMKLIRRRQAEHRLRQLDDTDDDF